MPYLIDGNNILGSWRGGARGEDLRPEVLRRVSEFCRTQGARAVLAFDGEPFRAGMARQDLGPVSVRFPEAGEDADALIRRVVGDAAHPEEVVVVTSDKALYSWCKTRGARALRAHEWNVLAGRPSRSRPAAEKPDREPDVDGWLRAFGADPSAGAEASEPDQAEPEQRAVDDAGERSRDPRRGPPPMSGAEEEPMTERPSEAEFAPYFGRYVVLVPETDIVGVLEQQADEIVQLTGSVPAERESHRYAEGKWTIREVLGHLVDAERVFGYRVFCISRGEQASLPSFDENRYVAAARSDATPLRELVDELVLVRRSNLVVLRRLSALEWARVGTSSGKPVSARAIAWVMAGHVRHHVKVLRERYLVS